jgi:magnesium-transporting ATPase (P-type)
MSWNGYLFKSAIIASVITFIIGMFTTGINSLNASIAGYSLLIITILGILIQLIRTPISNKEGNSTLKLLWIIIRQTGPFFLILAIIGFMLYLLISNKTPIINNHVSDSFYTFSNITLIFILILVYVIYNHVVCEGDECVGDGKYYDDSGKIGKMTNSILYLIAVFAMISTSIVYIILTFYRTDGFQGLQKNDSEKIQFNYLL